MANWEKVSFSGMFMSSWSADKEGIYFNGKKYLFAYMRKPISIFSKGGFGTNGVIVATFTKGVQI